MLFHLFMTNYCSKSYLVLSDLHRDFEVKIELTKIQDFNVTTSELELIYQDNPLYSGKLYMEELIFMVN